MLSLEQVYDEVDNLRGLVHPECRRSFPYMDDAAAIELARELTDKIVQSSIATVLVAETGASPLAEICDQIARRTQRKLNLRGIKFPREPLSSIFPVLAFFLSPEEKAERLTSEQCSFFRENSIILGALEASSVALGSLEAPLLTQVRRIEALEMVCAAMPEDFFSCGPAVVAELLARIGNDQQTPFQQAVSIVFQGTEVSNLIGSPFIYFDEYIDSGTTLRNAITFFKCFATQPTFKTVSYFTNVPDAAPISQVLHTRYLARDRPSCYEAGAYPFENRVDLIGHYYRIDADEYVRTELSSIEKLFTNAPVDDCSKMLSALFESVSRSGLLQSVSDRLSLPDVKHYIEDKNIIQRCLFELEKVSGTPDCAEFLYQLFDMYGPAWSPMPVSFHFDFWQGFIGFDETFRRIPQFDTLVAEYVKCRPSLLRNLAQICLERRRTWLTNIHTRLESEYGQGKSINSGGDRADSGVLFR